MDLGPMRVGRAHPFAAHVQPAFEALGCGDPRVKVAAFLEKIRKAFGL